MQFMQKVKDTIHEVVKNSLLQIRRSVEYLRDCLEGFFGIHPVEEDVAYTGEEEQVIHQAAEVVREYFPETPGEVLLSEDYESRCEALEDLSKSLAEIYGMKNVEVIITNSEDVFPDGKGITYGIAYMEQNRIYLNADYLQLDDPKVLENMVITLLHELRHIMQYQIMTLQSEWGVPYSRRRAWRENCKHYIRSGEDLEGYYKQPVEADARNFANRIWRSVYEDGQTMSF